VEVTVIFLIFAVNKPSLTGYSLYSLLISSQYRFTSETTSVLISNNSSLKQPNKAQIMEQIRTTLASTHTHTFLCYCTWWRIANSMHRSCIKPGYTVSDFFQCFEDAGWVTGRASGL